MQGKTWDVVLFGASGFTGRLVLEYINREYRNRDIKWAVAGRNREKLKTLLGVLGAEDIPVLLADSHDFESLHNIVLQTKVIITTVGPYALHGSKLVQACAESGTHYCDLSGEVHWMRKMIDQYGEVAEKNKCRIVHCCGFDSIPSDLGVDWFQEKIKRETGEYFKRISMRLLVAKGGISGGTFASMFNIREEAKKDRSIYKVIMPPYSLNPDPDFDGPDKPDLNRIKRDDLTGGWLAPFVMASINTRVVRRSHALRGFKYGRQFTYDEVYYCGKGFKGKIKAWKYVLPLLIIRAAMPGTWLYKVVRSMMPKQGSGPTRKQREAGYFKMEFLGLLPSGEKYRAKLLGDKDPGYTATSKMLAESAAALLKNYSMEDKPFGFVTPAVAFDSEQRELIFQKSGMLLLWEGQIK